MWICTRCNEEVDDRFDNCPQCGAGRDGSAPPVNNVRKKDALQPGLPAAGNINPKNQKRLVSIIIVLAVIVVLLIIALRR